MPNNPFPSNNPYAHLPRAKIKIPPVKDKADTADRQKRLGLDIFTYDCSACDKARAHSSGYLFVVMLNGNWLYFCNVDCCNAWEKSNPELKTNREPAPVTDRRGAILATREKNEKADSARKT